MHPSNDDIVPIRRVDVCLIQRQRMLGAPLILFSFPSCTTDAHCSSVVPYDVFYIFQSCQASSTMVMPPSLPWGRVGPLIAVRPDGHSPIATAFSPISSTCSVLRFPPMFPQTYLRSSRCCLAMLFIVTHLPNAKGINQLPIQPVPE